MMVQKRGEILAGAEPNEEESHCTSGGKGLREKQEGLALERETQWTHQRLSPAQMWWWEER